MSAAPILDLTGKLPTAEEAKAFIQDSDQNKRVALIDRLLDQSAHFDYWAMKWSDILRVKAEFPVKVWPNAAQAYHRWVWESIAQNKPYDQFARELLTSSGSNFRVGSVNFYRAIQDKTPEGIAASRGIGVDGHAGPLLAGRPSGRHGGVFLAGRLQAHQRVERGDRLLGSPQLDRRARQHRAGNTPPSPSR